MCGHTEIYRNGDCRDCDRQRTARYRKRRKLAMALLHAAEDRGLSGMEAIAVLKYVDYWTMQDCQESWHQSGEFKAVANAEW